MTPEDKDLAEPFRKLKEIAAILGLEYWKVLRCANAGLFPTYTFGNSRRYALVSEVQAAIRGAQ